MGWEEGAYCILARLTKNILSPFPKVVDILLILALKIFNNDGWFTLLILALLHL